MIIAIEGIDGAGKNTLVQALVNRLDATVLGFPRYETSVHAQLVQQALYGNMGDLTDSLYAMATLFALDRHDAREIIAEYANSPKVLLLDRYVASNAAYSAARAHDDALFDWVAALEFDQLAIPRPDLQVLLGTSPTLAAQRAANREATDASRKRDRYESDASLQQRTSDAYRRLAQQQWQSPWLVVEPTDDIQVVAHQIQAMVPLG